MKASPAAVEFARFIYENPGSSRKEILAYLWPKITLPGLTKKNFFKHGVSSLLSPRYSIYCSDKEGSERFKSGKMADWYRTADGPQGTYRYWLTYKGTRLLNADPRLPDDKRVYRYRNPDDYSAYYEVGSVSQGSSGMIYSADAASKVVSTKYARERSTCAISQAPVVQLESTKEVAMDESRRAMRSFTDEMDRRCYDAEDRAASFLASFVENSSHDIVYKIRSNAASARAIFGPEVTDYILKCMAVHDGLATLMEEIGEMEDMEQRFELGQ